MEPKSLLKIWVGAEQEGSSSGLTLFVFSEVINHVVLQEVIEAQRKTQATRVYLGAGNRDVRAFYAKIEPLRKVFHEVIIERSVQLLSTINMDDYDKVIVRVGNLPKEHVVLKTLDNENVYLYETPVCNSLDERCKQTGMYETDILITNKIIKL